MPKSKKPSKKPTPKKKKKAPAKYKEKFVVDGSFEDIMKELITPKNNGVKKS